MSDVFNVSVVSGGVKGFSSKEVLSQVVAASFTWGDNQVPYQIEFDQASGRIVLWGYRGPSSLAHFRYEISASEISWSPLYQRCSVARDQNPFGYVEFLSARIVELRQLSALLPNQQRVLGLVIQQLEAYCATAWQLPANSNPPAECR